MFANVSRARAVRAVPLVFLGLTACTVKLHDKTGPSLTYNPPANIQPFEAEVSKTGSVKVQEVTVNVDSAGAAPLSGPGTSSGAGLWQGGVPVPACEELVAYDFTVNYTRGGSSVIKTKRFPEVGAFVQSIANVDPMCSGVINASKTFEVSTTSDTADVNPGDGVCADSSSDGAQCSLRAAIMEANAHPGIDLIRVPSGRYTLTRQKPSGVESDATPEDQWGDLDITDSVAIVGLGQDSVHIGDLIQTSPSTVEPEGYLLPVDDDIDSSASVAFVKIDGNDIDRVFQVHNFAAEEGFVLMRKLALLNGRAEDRAGGGLLNEGNLRLERVAVYDNELAQGSGPGGVNSLNRGAGVANYGQLYATELAIVNNEVDGDTGFAGGLWVNRDSVATITNSLVALNAARFNGAIYVDGDQEVPSTMGRLHLTNVTITENNNTGSVQYAVRNNGKLSMSYVSLVQNKSARGGVSTRAGAETRLRNSLLVENQISSSSANDCSGTTDNQGNNVIKTAASGCSSSTSGTDLINFSEGVVLGGLVYRGGFTYVVRISPPFEPSSLLNLTDRIDADLSKPDTDQRAGSFDRAVDADGDGNAQMDVGAYEYDGP